MENRNNLLMVLLIAIAILLSWGLTNHFIRRSAPIENGTHVCKEDSLVNSLDSVQRAYRQLEIEKETEEDGWDKKEQRYEEMIFEYNYGLDYLKNYKPEEYKEFHRIISHKEYYSHEDERENKKRLNIKDEHNR